MLSLDDHGERYRFYLLHCIAENHVALVCALTDFAPIVRALLVCLLTLGRTEIGIRGRSGRRGAVIEPGFVQICSKSLLLTSQPLQVGNRELVRETFKAGLNLGLCVW